MPFQVTFAQKAIPSGIIQLVDAGPDGNAICDISFSLEATVIGNLAGHTVLWEQTAGVAVTFTTPVNQLAISYNQSTFEDKTFRFWVDKGTASQRFDDVSVFGSPTSIISRNKTFSGNHNNNTITTTNAFDADSLSIRLLPQLPTAQHSGFVIEKFYTSADLLWLTPHTDLTIIGFAVQSRAPSGTWADVSILPETAREYPVTDDNNLYKVDVIYRYPNSYVGRKSSNVILANGELNDSKLIAVDAPARTHSVSSSAIIGFVVETLSIVVKDPIIEQKAISISSNNFGIEGFSVDNFSLTLKPAPYDSTQGHTFSENTRIVDFDVTIVTGGQVGGS